jgi:iron(III) transport system permease protein
MTSISSRPSIIGAMLFLVSGVVLFVFLLWPVGMVFHAAWEGRDSVEPGLSLAAQRMSLAIETAKLIILVLAIALPVGVSCALVLFRTDLPGKWLWRMLILLPALVPIDLHATAWLATLGPQGLARFLELPIELKGLVGAAWVHAMASIPWVVAIVGPAVSTVEAELEEDCLLLVGPIRTMWHVTLRRSAGAVVAAGLIVAVLTAGEMAVTDLLQVRTYAETVYTEFALASRVGAATATAVPGLLVWLLLVAVAGVLLVRRVPQNAQALFARRPVFPLGPGRWLVLAGCVLVTALTLGIPTGSLVWRAGLKFPKLAVAGQDLRPGAENEAGGLAITADPQPSAPHWSARTFCENLMRSAHSARHQLALSLKVAALTAILTVPIAWCLVVFAQRNELGAWVLSGIVALLFALPGPVVGIGVKLALDQPYRWWGADPSSVGGQLAGLFDGIARSPAVLVWLHCLRALPFAIGVLWPVRRLVNRRLLEAAAIDGAGPWARFRFVELPACSAAILAAALVSGVLSIGELGGSVIVTPAGQQPLSVRIFTFAHYGLENHLAGICLVLLGVSAVGSIGVLLCIAWNIRRLNASEQP